MNQKTQNGTSVIAITGGKGGVGKTSISVNLGIALSLLGQRVALLDADLGLANVDVLLGLKPKENIASVVDGRASLTDVMIEGPAGLFIIPASSGVQEMVSLDVHKRTGLIHAFSEISDLIDVLLIDTAAGISAGVMEFLRASQEVVVVVCNEPTSVTDAYALIKVLHKNYGVDQARVVANMVRSAEEGRTVFSKLQRVADRFLDVNLQYEGHISHDTHVTKAVIKQRAVLDLYPESKIGRDFMRLAEKVSRWPIRNVPGGHVQFFIENLVADGRA